MAVAFLDAHRTTHFFLYEIRGIWFCGLQHTQGEVSMKDVS